jgi:hypothetical protein
MARQPPTHACPACGFIVFEAPPGSYELCPVCNWENDGAQYEDPSYRGGANAESLVEAQHRAVLSFPYELRRLDEWRRDPWWRPLMRAEVEAGPAAVPPATGDEVPAPYWRRSPLGWDTVLTVIDWWDGPIEGLANVDGRAHHFRVTWDDAADEYDHRLVELRPVDEATRALMLEDWEIWLRWSLAYRRDETTRETHPALPADRARNDELRRDLELRPFREAAPVLARSEWAWQRGAPGVSAFAAVRWEVLP